MFMGTGKGMLAEHIDSKLASMLISSRSKLTARLYRLIIGVHYQGPMPRPSSVKQQHPHQTHIPYPISHIPYLI
jgi:hypothetical protein